MELTKTARIHLPKEELDEVLQEKFGAFHGVFRPTILTIIGVMLYLREGWLVGHAGLAGAILIILTCYLITGATALSISSITTNIRMGSGGVFSIVSQSLGLEIGGAVGIPLYLAQGLSAAMYIHGFLEGWLFIFPEHEAYKYLILCSIFAVAFGLNLISTKFAFKVQMLVMFLIIGALFSMFSGLTVEGRTLQHPQLWGSFSEGHSYWTLFAVFFPAATGIMVGSSMSGSLTNARKSIPVGTMAAWGVSLLVYITIAIFYSYIATPAELVESTTIGIKRARWPEMVQVGLLASCFMATVSSLAAAPRVLQALASHSLVPKSETLAKTQNHEPRKAMYFTGLMVFVAMILGDLNAIAQILTMFFLLTYFTINLVLLIEQSLEMISFRPAFSIPRIVPVIGSLACLFAIVIISPMVGLIAIAFIIGLYIFFDRKDLKTPYETVHSGLFASVANWAAKKVFLEGRENTRRAWKPAFLVPLKRDSQLEGSFRLLRALAYPQGTIHAVGFAEEGKESRLRNMLPLIKDMQKEGIFSSTSTIEPASYESGLKAVVSVMKGSFFRPNIIFESIHGRTEEELQCVVDTASSNGMAVVFVGTHPEAAFGRERSINLWVRDQSPDWTLGLKLANLDCAVLLSHQLKRNWGASIRLLSAIRNEADVPAASEYLQQLMDLARMSSNIEVRAEAGPFYDVLARTPRADINIFGLSKQVNKALLEKLLEESGSSCLFILDSGNESALA